LSAESRILPWIQPRVVSKGAEPPPALPDEPLGDQLKSYFDRLTAGPVPDKLMRLTQALEEAFERGELSCSCRKPRSRD
jgi:hypothetical protein